MSPIEIRSGLRRLEFEARGAAAQDDSDHGSDHALVEFVRPAPIPDNESVRVQLGLRDGVLREVVGEPALIGTTSDDGKAEYHYRLRGAIGSSRSDFSRGST